MDAQDTAGFTEPCSQCSEVNWGISEEGRFYCQSCHTVVERSREVQQVILCPASSRITRIKKGPRTKTGDGGYSWRICEAFQFILKNQAEALLELGVTAGFKDVVLCRMWRIYLQKSRQAFTNNPVYRDGQGGADSDSDSGTLFSVSSTDFTESRTLSDSDSQPESSCRRRKDQMSMRKTLALIHLALVWSREALTLSDLLRLVLEGHVPYVKAYEQLPDQMRLKGRDVLVFRVESVPSYRLVHQDAQALALFLQLPAFPPVSQEVVLHPARLSLRYLIDANLPDELHLWVCRLTERAGLADQALNTFDPASRPVLPRYDLQAAALVVVTMKLLFGLDDLTEWDLSNQVKYGPEDTFHLRRWYRLVQTALVRGQQRSDHATARTQWKPKKIVFRRSNERYMAMKKKRTAEQLQSCFERLSSCPAGVQTTRPSSFRFCWGDSDGSDGPSMHGTKLDRFLTLKDDVQTPSNRSYWHPALQPCNGRQCNPDHFLPEVEASLPKSFRWLLQLFSFLLHVKPAALLQEVLSVERRLFGCKTPGLNARTGTRTSPRTPRQVCRTRLEAERTRRSGGCRTSAL